MELFQTRLKAVQRSIGPNRQSPPILGDRKQQIPQIPQTALIARIVNGQHLGTLHPRSRKCNLQTCRSKSLHPAALQYSSIRLIGQLLMLRQLLHRIAVPFAYGDAAAVVECGCDQRIPAQELQVGEYAHQKVGRSGEFVRIVVAGHVYGLEHVFAFVEG